MRLIVASLAPALLLGGCMGRPALTSDVKMIGGSPAAAEVASLVVKYATDSEWCSAALVSKHTLLTAGHCVVGGSYFKMPNIEPGAKMTVSWGGPEQERILKMVTAKSVTPHPTWINKLDELAQYVDWIHHTQDKTPNPRVKEVMQKGGIGQIAADTDGVYDVALIDLSEDLPVDDLTLRIAKVAKAAPRVGDKIDVTGYGCRAIGGAGAAHVFMARKKIAVVNATNFIVPVSDATDAASPPAASEVCAGDSGGPAFRTGSSELVGVNSTEVARRDADGNPLPRPAADQAFLETQVARTDSIATWICGQTPGGC